MASPPQKILVVGPAWIGDMVLAQSLFKILRQRHPQSRLDVLAPAWTHPLLSRMPEVNEAIAAPFAHGRFDLGVRLCARSRLARTTLRPRDRGCRIHGSRRWCRGPRAFHVALVLPVNCVTDCSTTRVGLTRKNGHAPWTVSSRSVLRPARHCRKYPIRYFKPILRMHTRR